MNKGKERGAGSAAMRQFALIALVGVTGYGAGLSQARAMKQHHQMTNPNTSSTQLSVHNGLVGSSAGANGPKTSSNIGLMTPVKLSQSRSGAPSSGNGKPTYVKVKDFIDQNSQEKKQGSRYEGGRRTSRAGRGSVAKSDPKGTRAGAFNSEILGKRLIFDSQSDEHQDESSVFNQSNSILNQSFLFNTYSVTQKLPPLTCELRSHCLNHCLSGYLNDAQGNQGKTRSKSASKNFLGNPYNNLRSKIEQLEKKIEGFGQQHSDNNTLKEEIEGLKYRLDALEQVDQNNAGQGRGGAKETDSINEKLNKLHKRIEILCADLYKEFKDFKEKQEGCDRELKDVKYSHDAIFQKINQVQEWCNTIITENNEAVRSEFGDVIQNLIHRFFNDLNELKNQVKSLSERAENFSDNNICQKVQEAVDVHVNQLNYRFKQLQKEVGAINDQGAVSQEYKTKLNQLENQINGFEEKFMSAKEVDGALTALSVSVQDNMLTHKNEIEAEIQAQNQAFEAHKGKVGAEINTVKASVQDVESHLRKHKDEVYKGQQAYQQQIEGQINQQNMRLDDHVKAFNKHQKAIESSVDQVKNAVQEIEKKTQEYNDKINKKIEKQAQNIVQINTNVDQLGGQIQASVEEVKNEFAERQNAIDVQLQGYERKIETVLEEVKRGLQQHKGEVNDQLQNHQQRMNEQINNQNQQMNNNSEMNDKIERFGGEMQKFSVQVGVLQQNHQELTQKQDGLQAQYNQLAQRQDQYQQETKQIIDNQKKEIEYRFDELNIIMNKEIDTKQNQLRNQINTAVEEQGAQIGTVQSRVEEANKNYVKIENNVQVLQKQQECMGTKIAAIENVACNMPSALKIIVDMMNNRSNAEEKRFSDHQEHVQKMFDIYSNQNKEIVESLKKSLSESEAQKEQYRREWEIEKQNRKNFENQMMNSLNEIMKKLSVSNEQQKEQ